ncbi:MAG: D-alanine--D-alanine ligase [Defluviitaleaceae bacterium]|nr:D-alanine--D-alanine ligase [Defluviitaleaceae bacterium]
MNQKNVLVLFGGCSPEHEISKESANAVMGALGRHNIIPVYITRAGKWLLYDGKLDSIQGIDWEKFGTPAILSPDRVNRGLLRIVGDKVKTIRVDVVFPVLHGPNGEDGTVQGLCELAGIPYVGCGVTASAVAMDKSTARLVARSFKIPQADFLVFDRVQLKADIKSALKKIRYKLGYPCFVKPNTGGSSIGISKASNRKELITALETAAGLSSRVIVEKAVTGREIEIGILGTGIDAKASVAGEIIPAGEFYDYDSKYENPDSQTIVPADLPEEILAKLQKYSLEIFRAIGGRGLARADFFVTEDGVVLFSEINTVPGFTKISLFGKVWEDSGVPWQELIEKLIELAVSDA